MKRRAALAPPAALALAFLASLLSACTAHRPASSSSTVVRSAAVEAHAPVALPSSPDVSGQVMGWVVLRDGMPLVRALALAGHVAPADVPADAPATMLGELVGMDRRLTEALDLRRPLAFAVLNPSLMKNSAAMPVLAMVPVRSADAVERALTASAIRHTRTAWGGLRVETVKGPVYLVIRDGYAQLAARPELVEAAGRVLAAPLAARASPPLSVHVSFDNLYSWYGPQLRALLGQLALTDVGSGDPQVVFATRAARALTRYAQSIRDVDVLVDADGEGLSFTLRVDGKPGSPWDGYVASQQPSDAPVWGARLVPRDAVLVYATRRTGFSMRADDEAAVAYLGDASLPPASDARRAEWRGALALASATMAGDLVYAVWPGLEGGIGVGGAYRVSGDRAARAQVMNAYHRIGGDMVGVVARALELDPRRYRLQVGVHANVTTVLGTAVDTVEVTVRWPAGSTVERRRFEHLFGSKMVLATAFVGNSAVYALGRDWRPRITGMIAAAAGEDVPSLASDPAFQKAAGWHQRGRVSFTYLPTQPMVDLLGRLVAYRTGVGDVEHGEMLAAQLVAALGPDPTAGSTGAIVSTTNAFAAGRYEMTSRLPATSIPGLMNVGGALWRIAISPILNPPAFPPLPLPPAHVTPHLPVLDGPSRVVPGVSEE